MAPFKELGGDAPIADAFKDLGKDWIAAIVYVGALAATLKTVMLLMLGQSRVAFAMCRDRLLPERLGRTHERYGTPHKITLITMVVVAAMAGFVPLSTLAELVNIGTLFAFMLVAAGVLYLRSTDPERERPFRTPLVAGRPAAGDRRLHLPRGHAAGRHLDPLRGVDGARARRLRAVRARVAAAWARTGGRRELDDVAARVATRALARRSEPASDVEALRPRARRRAAPWLQTLALRRGAAAAVADRRGGSTGARGHPGRRLHRGGATTPSQPRRAVSCARRRCRAPASRFMRQERAVRRGAGGGLSEPARRVPRCSAASADTDAFETAADGPASAARVIDASSPRAGVHTDARAREVRASAQHRPPRAARRCCRCTSTARRALYKPWRWPKVRVVIGAPLRDRTRSGRPRANASHGDGAAHARRDPRRHGA